MSFNLTYGLLFEVTLYHNYFLNNGEDTYAGMSDANKKKCRKNSTAIHL